MAGHDNVWKLGCRFSQPFVRIMFGVLSAGFLGSGISWVSQQCGSPVSSLVVVGARPVRMSLGAAVTACGGVGGGCLLFGGDSVFGVEQLGFGLVSWAGLGPFGLIHIWGVLGFVQTGVLFVSNLFLDSPPLPPT